MRRAKAELLEFANNIWFLSEAEYDFGNCLQPCTTVEYSTKLVTKQRNSKFISHNTRILQPLKKTP